MSASACVLRLDNEMNRNIFLGLAFLGSTNEWIRHLPFQCSFQFSTFVNDNYCINTKNIYFWVSFQLCLAVNIMLFFLLIWNYISRNHFQVNLFVKLASSKASVLSNNVSISKKNYFFSLTFLSSFFWLDLQTLFKCTL